MSPKSLIVRNILLHLRFQFEYNSKSLQAIRFNDEIQCVAKRKRKQARISGNIMCVNFGFI